MTEAMRIDKYEIKEILGEGGMSLVYRAQHETGRIVCIKVLHPSMALNQDLCTRFEKEISIARKLRHPNIVRVLDSGICNNQLFLTMQYMQGGDLSARIKSGISPHVALSIAADVADALQYAHDSGLIHRDIKPGNVLFDLQGRAYLADFGIAKVVSQNTQLTRTGMYLGTPYYMSPEQARGKKVDARADIYSLGILLYEMLTGSKPYHADDNFAIALMHINDAVPALPSHLTKIQELLDLCLAKDAADRYSCAKEFSIAARRLATSIPVTKINQPAETTFPRKIPAKTDYYPKNKFAVRATIALIAMTSIVAITAYHQTNQQDLTDRTAATKTSPGQPSIAEKNKEPSITFQQATDKNLNTDSEIDYIKQPSTIIAVTTPPEDTVGKVEAAQKDSIKSIPPKITAISDPEIALVRSLTTGISQDIAASRLSLPTGNNAIEKINQLLEIDRKNEFALSAKKSIIEKYENYIDTALTNNRVNQARKQISRLASISPDTPSLRAAKQRLAQIDQEQQQAALMQKALNENKSKKPASDQNTVSDKLVTDLLSSARAAIASGELQSARQFIQSAQSIKQDIPEAEMLLKELNTAEANALVRETNEQEHKEATKTAASIESEAPDKEEAAPTEYSGKFLNELADQASSK